MNELMKKTKVKDIFFENFGQQWSRRRSMRPCSAKDTNTRQVDDLTTEYSNCDIARMMRKQMDEMTHKMRTQMQQMHTMMKFSIDAMHIHNKEHANRLHGGPGPFGFPTSHNANAGASWVATYILLTFNDGMQSPRTRRLILMILRRLAVAIPTPRSTSELRVDLFEEEVAVAGTWHVVAEQPPIKLG